MTVVAHAVRSALVVTSADMMWSLCIMRCTKLGLLSAQPMQTLHLVQAAALPMPANPPTWMAMRSAPLTPPTPLPHQEPSALPSLNGSSQDSSGFSGWGAQQRQQQ